MKVSNVLSGKGVVTVTSQETVEHLLELLAKHGIGAVVVSDDGTSVHGIVSERDVVRKLHERGAGVLQQPVSSIMTSQVQTCGPGDDVAELARTMTVNRFRHIPVIADGKLTGIVSIGDVVKSRIESLELERDQLTSYISS